MEKNKRGLKRIIKRIKEEFKASREIAKKLTFRKAFATFIGKLDIQIMVHNGRKEYKWIKKQLLHKHQIMNEFFDKIFNGFIPNIEQKNEDKNFNISNNIWICWWQGTKDMPEIVKTCIHSIKKNSGKHNVIIITEENYKNYVQFPDWVEEKFKNGIISKTHLSDILRIELLSRYGGIWLDSTFYCTGNLEKYFTLPVWSIKRPDYRHTSVACGEFANYSFGCNYETRYVFSIIKEYLYEYWKLYDYMIDYLFLDYIIVYAINHNEIVKQKFEEIKPNNPECDELLKIINKEYNEEVFRNLIKETDLFKLSWKCTTNKDINRKQTFYGKLIEREK